jgi:septal ring factor EnvC (AmiA/AmiB activator)
MNKKLLLITLGAGFLTFLVMIATVVFVLPQSPPEAPADLNQMDPSEASQRTSYAEEPAMAQANSLFTEGGSIKRNLSEVQLKSLIFEVRSNIKAYKTKLADVQLREQRLQIAQDMLREDITELSELRVELASAVTTLRDERDKLEKSLVEIEANEIANLQLISAFYDKMDATSAGKILLNMSQNQSGSSSDDAVKILYFMTERVKADVLASIAETEPAISAYYCSELKLVTVRE